MSRDGRDVEKDGLSFAAAESVSCCSYDRSQCRGSSKIKPTPGMVTYICSPSMRTLKAEHSIIQAHACLQSKFESSLCYMRPCIKNKTKRKPNTRNSYTTPGTYPKILDQQTTWTPKLTQHYSQ